MERKPDYSPPGWLVSRFDIELDEEHAIKFNSFRQRMADATGSPGNHTDFPFLDPNKLWMDALDFLLEHEVLLLNKIQGIKNGRSE